MNLAKRLQTVLDETGIDQVELARVATVTKGAINQLLKGDIQSLKLEYAVGIQDAYGYNAVWLVLGKGPKKTTESVSVNIIHSPNRGMFDGLSDEAKQLIECVRRIDGRSDVARKSFKLLTGLLLLSAKQTSVQDLSAGIDLVTQAEHEAEEAIARTTTPEGENVIKRKRNH